MIWVLYDQNRQWKNGNVSDPFCYSLPQIPNKITDVTIPAGTKMQASVGNNILYGTQGGGGGVQFQIQNAPSKPGDFDKWFSNARALK